MERTGTPWRAILFWGTCWGILESTVGALLHLLLPDHWFQKYPQWMIMLL